MAKPKAETVRCPTCNRKPQLDEMLERDSSSMERIAIALETIADLMARRIAMGAGK